MSKAYTSKDIKILTDREHVRLRTALYMGSMEKTEVKLPTFHDKKFTVETIEIIPACYKAIGEILDNSIDEFSQVYSKRHKLTIDAKPDIGRFTITDNGRGIPIDMHESGKFTPEVVLASLRSGRNFQDEKSVGTIGQNGVGSSVVNFLSKEFGVTIHRDKKKYQQMFENGCDLISNAIVQKSDEKTSTSISFKLDDTIFSDVSIPDSVVRNRAKEIAITNPSVEVTYNGESFRYRKVFDEIVSKISNNYHKFEFIDGKRTFEVYVIFDIIKDIDEEMFTWVNSSLLFEGGSCNTQFMNSFVSKVTAHLDKEATKQKSKITRNDIRENLLILGNIKISDPQYNSQSKLYLTGPSMRRELDIMIDDSWASFIRKNRSWLDEVLERAFERHHKSANSKAIKDHEKTNRKLVQNFIDANSRNRKDCSVFVTEGLSASSEISSVRKSATQASFALTGKINNVYGVTPAQLLKMGKITDMLTVFGLVPKRKADIGNMNFGKIIIATDADPDGAHIFTLIINILYQFWSELFNAPTPIVYRLNAPNVVASHKGKRVHFTTLDHFNNEKSKYRGWEVMYYKGLGSMVKEDWKMIMNDLDTYCIPIVDDGKMGSMLDMLFNNDTDTRKKWLT